MRNAVLAEVFSMGRFAGVGIAATLLHLSIALLLVSGFGWRNQPANVAAFCPALVLSFLGHYHWSFRSRAPRAAAALRFLAVALLGYLASAAAIGLLNALLGPGHEKVAVLGALVVPPVSYLANRFFVFR